MFTTLLNITLNKPTLCCKPFCCLSKRDYVEPYAINRLCLSMRNVRDYHPVEDCDTGATRGLVRFSFRPKSPQKGRGHLKHDFRLTERLLPDSAMTYRG